MIPPKYEDDTVIRVMVWILAISLIAGFIFIAIGAVKIIDEELKEQYQSTTGITSGFFMRLF